MPELSRADRIAAAQKKLKEFQAAKANKNTNESYSNQNSSVDTSGSTDYQANNTPQHTNYPCMLPSDTSQFSQGQPGQYQQHYNLPNVTNTGYYANSEIYQPQQPQYDMSSAPAEYNNTTTSNSLASYFNNPNNYYYCPAPPTLQPPIPPPPPAQASVPFVPSSIYATPAPPPPTSSTFVVVSHYDNGVSGGVSSGDYYTPVANLTNNQILSSPTSSLASSAFQIPSNRNMHQTIPPPPPPPPPHPVELNVSTCCNPLDLNDQNQMTSNGCPAATATTATSSSSVVCPGVYQNTFSSMPYDVNISTNDDIATTTTTTTTTKEESHLESEIDDKVTVDNMPTATTEKLLQLTRQLDGILETSERLTSLHTSGATSPLMNEYSSFRTGSNRILSSPSSLLESYSYLELSNQQNHRMVESFEQQQQQQQKEFLRSTPNSYMSGQSSQVCTGQNSLVRELEERNVELASMLEKRNRAFERLQVKLDSMKEQYERRFNDLANERTTLQNSSQRDLEKTKEQIRAHAKTIGVLVAEKTELQSQVAHLDNLAAERLKEIEEITSRLKSSRQQILDLERSASESKTVVNELHTGNNDLRLEVERLQVDLKREKNTRQNLENELSETNSRLTAKSCELAQMGISLNELKQQLELSQIYANQLGNTGESLAGGGIENENYRHQQEWLTERINLQNRLKELELSLSSADTEKGRLESQYRNYVAQVEQQSNELRTQLSETNKLKQELELSLESVNRKLREKDDEINDLTCRLSSVQIIQPTTSLPAVVETQSPKVVNNEKSEVVVITTTPAASSTSTSDQSSTERIESLENQLKHRTEELDNSTTEIQRLTMQLYSLQETVKSLQASLADRDSVLATATSERSALSRAMEQNKTLKQQVTDLQDAYTQMTTTNANLSVQLQQLESECKQSSNSMTNYQKQVDELNKQCDAYQLELKSANEMNYALSKQIEHLNILQQAESLNQAETMNQSTNVLSVDKIIQTIHIEDNVEEQNKQGKSDSVQHEQYQGQQQQDATNMNALLAKLETDQIHVNQLTNEVTMLQNLFTRVTKLCYELQVQNEQDKELMSQFSDPVYCINTLEESVKRLMCKSSLSVNDTCVQCSISMEQKALEDLEILQVAHTQLEAKFIKCMEELSTVAEERSRLESVNAQLEMEATTVEEYVTLFTHRRAAAAKRARARELLLQRLVDDRKRLRLRLQQLYKQMKPVQSQETNGIHNEHLGDRNTTEEVNDTNFSPGFLNEFQNLIQEIEPTLDESEFESGASNLNDEDMGNSMKDPTSGDGVGDADDGHGEEFVHHNSTDDIQQENHAAQLSSSSPSLQSLRYHALRHDCPHCKCCVGNLLEV